MHFINNGTEYRLGFRYPVLEKKRRLPSPIPGRQLLQIDTYRAAEAVLWQKVPGPRAGGNPDATYHWEPVGTERSDCSIKDRWNRARGREIALGRLRLSLPEALSTQAIATYNAR